MGGSFLCHGQTPGRSTLGPRSQRTNPRGRGRVAVVVHRFAVYLVCLVLTVGSELQKSRPRLIISPDEMNRHINTVIIAPMTTRGRDYPTRVPCTLQGRQAQIRLDHIRTVDKARLIRKLGRITPPTQRAVVAILQSMFAP